MCGGGGSGASKDQLNQQNALQKQAFDMMQQRQNQVGGAVSQYLSGNVGFDPQQLALMKSQFLNSNAQNYQTAGANVRTALLRSGSADSSTPVGGDYTRGIAGLEGGLASSTSGGLANIDLQNLSQALNNKFNAASLINGQAAQLTSPIGTFGSGASNALNQYAQSQQSTFGNQFFKSFGSGLGSAAASAATGGFGSALTGLSKLATPSLPSYANPQTGGFCWIAEELYGVDAPKTHAIRGWLKNEYSQTPVGETFVDWYQENGESMAAKIKADPDLRDRFQSLFDGFADQAMTPQEDFEGVAYQR